MLLQTIEGLPSDGLTLFSGVAVSEPVSAPLKKVASQSGDFQFDDDVAPGELEDENNFENEVDDDFDEDDFDDDFDDDFEDWREENTDEFDESEGVPFRDDAAAPCVPDVTKEKSVDGKKESKEEEVSEDEKKEEQEKGKKKKK